MNVSLWLMAWRRNNIIISNSIKMTVKVSNNPLEKFLKMNATLPTSNATHVDDESHKIGLTSYLLSSGGQAQRWVNFKR